MSVSETNASNTNLDTSAVLEKLGEGVLIFDGDNRLVMDNHVARKILGSNLVVIRQQGWPAFAMIVDRDRDEDDTDTTADSLRAKALRQTEPIRFHIMVGETYTPCWMSAVQKESLAPLTIVCIERSDWTPVYEFMTNLRKEGLPAIDDTLGHAQFMIQIAKRVNEKTKLPQLAGQMQRFATLIENEMSHLQILFKQTQRLELIRTGKIEEQVKQKSKKVVLEDFLEDLLEELAENYSKRDNDDDKDIRDRINIEIDDGLAVIASPTHLETIVKDVLNNAILYSNEDSPIQIRAFATNQKQSVQINFIDEGIGIRESEYDRVFKMFARARQPKVIAEFGFGVSLALCKADMEAMSGRIWFSSEEGVGTTFSLKLPAHRED